MTRKPSASALLARLKGVRLQYGDHPEGDYQTASEWAAGFRASLRELDTADLLVSAGLVTDQVDLIRDAHFSGEVQEALRRVGTDLPNGALHFFRANQLMGWTNLIEGTVFEQAVADAANAGLITLPPGVDGVELASRTQDGWDLALMNGNEIVGHAQVKFSANDHSILVHLHNHPDVPIVIANREAASAALSHGTPVIDSGIGYSNLHSEVAEQVSHHLDFAHFVHEWIPETAAIFILGTAAYRRWWKGETAENIKAWTKAQLATAGAANTAATLASVATGHELVRIPVAITTRMLWARGAVTEDAAHRASWLQDQIRRLRDLEGADGIHWSPVG